MEKENKEQSFLELIRSFLIDGLWESVRYNFYCFLDDAKKTALNLWQDALTQFALLLVSLALVFSGVIFLLVSIAVGINELLRQSASFGFAAAGLLAVILGLFFGRQRQKLAQESMLNNFTSGSGSCCPECQSQGQSPASSKGKVVDLRKQNRR